MSQDFLGLSTWLRLAIEGNDLTPFAEFLLERAQEDENDHHAVMDLSYVAQLLGNRDWGVALQFETLKKQQLFSPSETCLPNARVKVLTLNTYGDLKQNTPIEVLFLESENSLSALYLGEGVPFEVRLPEHDTLFVAIAPNENNVKVLTVVEELINTGVNREVINHPSQLIKLLDIDSITKELRQAGVSYDINPDLMKLKKIQGFVANYRIVLVSGVPFVYEVVIADKITDYLSAEMSQSNERLNIENALMESFEQDITIPYSNRWSEINNLLGLDYVGINCSVGENGELIISNIDPSIFVHDFDSVNVANAKHKAFQTLKAAFHQMLYRKAFPESKLFYRG